MAMMHIENMHNGMLNFKLKGDEREIADMIRHVLEARPDMLPVFAGAVLSYFKDHNIDPDHFLKRGRV